MQACSHCPHLPTTAHCGLCRSCIHLLYNTGRSACFLATVVSNTSTRRPARCLTPTALDTTNGEQITHTTHTTPHTQRRLCPARTTQPLLSNARWAGCKPPQYPSYMKPCPFHCSTLQWGCGERPPTPKCFADLTASLAYSGPCWLPCICCPPCHCWLTCPCWLPCPCRLPLAGCPLPCPFQHAGQGAAHRTRAPPLTS